MVAVVTVMGMSLHRITYYTYVYTSGLHLFNCGRGQKGVYPGKTRFRKYRFRGITYMSI